MKDIIIDDEFDLIFTNGDFLVDDSKDQSVQMLLLSAQGEWKEHPEAGADIRKAENGLIDQFLERNIRVQLEADNFNIEKLIIGSDGFQITGDYDGI